jgi:hypothetical protein
VLHITNGDCAVAVLSQVLPGTLLPWRDALHEGPVHADLSLANLSGERAAFIAQAGWGTLDKILDDFRERDTAVQDANRHEEVVLWFEHDLYDQLQLIQLLDWFARHPHPRLSLVSEAEYLGLMSAARAAQLFALRKPVSARQLEIGRAAWRVFGASRPQRISTAPVNELPFLGAAMRRFLQEYPWATDGLSMLEREIIEALRPKPLEFGSLFRQIREEPAFLGDSILLWHLQRMAREGLLRNEGNAWAYSGTARLARSPRWLGGVCVDARSPWRWNPASAQIVRASG